MKAIQILLSVTLGRSEGRGSLRIEIMLFAILQHSDETIKQKGKWVPAPTHYLTNTISPSSWLNCLDMVWDQPVWGNNNKTIWSWKLAVIVTFFQAFLQEYWYLLSYGNTPNKSIGSCVLIHILQIRNMRRKTK